MKWNIELVGAPQFLWLFSNAFFFCVFLFSFVVCLSLALHTFADVLVRVVQRWPTCAQSVSVPIVAVPSQRILLLSSSLLIACSFHSHIKQYALVVLVTIKNGNMINEVTSSSGCDEMTEYHVRYSFIVYQLVCIVLILMFACLNWCRFSHQPWRHNVKSLVSEHTSSQPLIHWHNNNE